MINVLLFQALQLAVSAYAIWRGGMPERIVAGLLIAAAAVSALGGIPIGRYHSLDVEQLLIDGLLFLALVLVAARANRFWPLWVSAFQLLAVGAHAVRAYDPTVLPLVYALMLSKLAYPICLTLVIGTWNFHRRSLSQVGRARDWSPLRW